MKRFKPPTLKIIFVDIDGVLNTLDRSACDPPDFDPITRFETRLRPECIDRINRLGEKHPTSRIVMSTSWRDLDKQFHPDHKDADMRNFDLRTFMQRSGLKVPFHKDWHTPLPEYLGHMIHGRPRGFEIGEWLSNHKRIKCWVALDDMTWGFSDEPKNFEADISRLVNTDPMKAFTEEDFELADKILQRI